ncbi:MAG: transposase domain-containing protein [Saprospiraceae bacterium]|nr:transposase domain-containing protein [Saprospiraceae bacterium]
MFVPCSVPARYNNINPYKWLNDILLNIKDHPINRISELFLHHQHTPS